MSMEAEYFLENDFLKVSARSYGGELRSIEEKADGTKYLWEGDPTWWKYSSPVLFPIVGAVNDNKYRYAGKEYELPQHGFGRISEYELLEKKDDFVSFVLNYSEETLKVYPFKFRLEISYQLEGKAVKVGWKVKNVDNQDMYFSIGAHPAFLCPVGGKGEFTDAYLEFSSEEESDVRELKPGCKLTHDRRKFLKGKTLPLNYDMFKEDARIFDDLKSESITIKSNKSDKTLTVKAPGFPYYGIWTPVKGGAPYLCLEPWHGHADYYDFTGELSEKEGMIKLAAGEEFNSGYSIIIG